MKGLEGKTAIVTGGSSGIGQAIAIGLGHEGVNVAVNYVGQPEGAEATKDAIDSGVQQGMREVEAAGRVRSSSIHMDGLNHLQIGDRTYNGHHLVDLVEEL